MEMMASCLVLALLVVTLGYALKLALASTGNGAAQAAATLDAGDVVGRITDDLNEAINFTEKTSNSVTFTVPDRDGDGNPEKIRYQWWPTAGTYTIPGSGGSSGGTTGSGSGGGGLLGGLLGGVLGLLGGSTTTTSTGDTIVSVPAYTLTRQVNDGTVAVLGDDVRQFALSYLYRSMSPTNTTTGSTEKLLWSYEAAAGLTVTYKDFLLNDKYFTGCIFQPSSVLPAGTTSFSITRISVQLQMDSGTRDGLNKLSVRPASGSAPGSSVLERSATQVLEVSLSDTYGWIDFPFSTCNNLSAAVGQKYCFVIEGSQPGNSAEAGYAVPLLGLGLPGGTAMVQSSNSGSSWSSSTSQSLRYRIYGTTTP
jgi:hypothetical protein